MTLSQFDEDLERGNLGERLFQEKYPSAVKAKGYHPDWDFTYNGNTFEVKTDYRTVVTGNIFLEQECFFETKADYFFFVVANGKEVVGTYMVKTWVLDNIVNDNEYTVKENGVTGNTKGWLIPESIISEVSEL